MPGTYGAVLSDVLDAITVVNNELDVSAGGSSEARAILAINLAQHYFESIAASMPRVLSQGISTNNVATANSTETSTWNTTLRRLDALWYLDSNGLPIRKLKRIVEFGGHVPSLPWPLQIALTTTWGGAPFGYYADMNQFFWLPRPDGAYNIRIYGFFKQAEFSTNPISRTANFNYPLECKLPIAQFAAKMLSTSVGDDSIEYDKLGSELFRPLLRQLRKFDRSEPMPRFYSEFHAT